jgi:cyclopropane fatty-acyl-phospholipid synthase-like methyltransferase
LTDQNLHENWDYADSAEKIYQLGSFGIHPSDFQLIAKNRYERADHIADLLDIGPRDVVLDLGSGMGFMAERLASRCLWLHCADVSETYLVDCRKRVAPFSNVETHLIPYANLAALDRKGVSKIYSALLFIHFNFYDLTYYLREAHRILNAGGLFFFDYNDGDVFRYDNKLDSFNEHLRDYRKRRLEWIFGCMQMMSGTALRNLVPQIGFEVVSIHPSRSAFTEIVVRKME